MLWPVDKLWSITTHFGEIQTILIDGVLTTLPAHPGVDIGCPTGTKVHAPLASYVSRSDTAEGGYCLTLQAGDYNFRFCHLAELALTEGYFSEGEVVAFSDTTGTWITGAHLHFEVRYKGVLVDPLSLTWGGQMPNTPSIISVSTQAPGYVTKDFVAQVVDAGITRIKAMDVDAAANPWPSWMELILRLYLDDRDLTYAMQGRAGAESWWKEVYPRAMRVPQKKILEGPNEPPHATVPQLQALCEFSIRAAELCATVGWSYGSMNFSEGNPEPWQIPYIVDALRGPNVWLDLHEYRMVRFVWQDLLDPASDHFHVGRYRTFMDSVHAVDSSVNPPLYIGECFIDNPYGWLGVADMTPAKGLERLQNQEAYYKQPGTYPVAGMYPFISFPFVGQWQTFDMATLHAPLLAYIKASHNPNADPFLLYANQFVFPVNLDAALNKYGLGIKGWSLDSQEFQKDGWTCEWFYDKANNKRVLCRAQAPTWAVEEYATIAN